MSRDFITKNEHYSVEIEPDNNRIYISMMNLWRSEAIGVYLLSELRKLKTQLLNEFSAVVDLTALRLSKHPNSSFFLLMQTLLTEMGAGYIAYVIPEKGESKFKILLEADSNKKTKKTTISKVEEAEMWLKITEAMKTG